MPVIVDPKPVNSESFKFATLICPNIGEAKEIIGEENLDNKEVAKRLKSKLDTKYIVITCGKKGMIVYDGEKFIDIPTKAKELVDVTGAGDTVASIITLAIASGLDLESAAHLANYAAGIVVGKQGT